MNLGNNWSVKVAHRYNFNQRRCGLVGNPGAMAIVLAQWVLIWSQTMTMVETYEGLTHKSISSRTHLWHMGC